MGKLWSIDTDKSNDDNTSGLCPGCISTIKFQQYESACCRVRNICWTITEIQFDKVITTALRAPYSGWK